jgi:4a-hydroxytetrahydrobiopterin dehydratase
MDNEKLYKKKCIPCSGDILPIVVEEARYYLKKISNEWILDETSMQLWRKYSFKDFETPLQLLNKIAEIAEAEWHHPELIIGYGKLEVGIWTHKINGLVESDFVLAAKIDQLGIAESS